MTRCILDVIFQRASVVINTMLVYHFFIKNSLEKREQQNKATVAFEIGDRDIYCTLVLGAEQNLHLHVVLIFVFSIL